MSEPPAKRIDGRAKTVVELLDRARYTIDFYQREYAWEQRQVRELVEDLTGKFLDSYDESHERGRVAGYDHYFLGSIVISNKNQQRFIVDGQQRLTTLTLLLIHLHHLVTANPGLECESVETLIFSTKFGQRRFNIDVDDRARCMDKLFHEQKFDPAGESDSVRNIVARFDDISELFSAALFGDGVSTRALPFFIDWLKECVHLVEIEAYSDEDAYTIFETMNDRGLSLSLPDMLKGYVLANIDDSLKQRHVNELWKKHVTALKDLGKDEEVDFFKNWLRAAYADSIQQGSRDREHKDYERIGSEFHRWVRDQKTALKLTGSAAFARFIERDFDFYAKQTLLIRNAAKKPVDGLEAIYFNDQRDLTVQTQVLLAALAPDDPPDVTRKKLGLVATYLDIWMTRLAWAGRSTAQRNIRHAMFTLTKAIRGKTVAELATVLRQRLDEDRTTFARHPDLGLRPQNFYAVRHILARLTHWVDKECGLSPHFEDYFSTAKGRPFEVEHLWSNQFDKFRAWFEHEAEFDTARNRLGGLVLLHRGTNQSLNDAPYANKVGVYLAQGQSILTRSLHDEVYRNNPAFTQLIERTGLPFRPHAQFDREAQKQRQELYIRIAEFAWNPSKLDLDGEKPPQPEPIVEDEVDDDVEEVDRSVRHDRRKTFWTTLVAVARAQDGPHGKLTPTIYSWLGARDAGFWWNFSITRHGLRIELGISTWEPVRNKAIFDGILGHRAEVEARAGRPLDWMRLDGNLSSRVSIVLPGGWGDDGAFETLARTAVDTMKTFRAALESFALAARDATAAMP